MTNLVRNHDANEHPTLSAATQGAGLLIGEIAELCESGEILVRSIASPSHCVLCDFLESSDNATLTLQAGDRVLYVPAPSIQDKGCVVGRIGGYRQPDRDHVEVTATKSLRLTCGDASVQLRDDGKILTKGMDVVSIARQNQRIKGGSVQIN